MPELVIARMEVTGVHSGLVLVLHTHIADGSYAEGLLGPMSVLQPYWLYVVMLVRIDISKSYSPMVAWCLFATMIHMVHSACFASSGDVHIRGNTH